LAGGWVDIAGEQDAGLVVDVGGARKSLNVLANLRSREPIILIIGHRF
jgi:hypothetical protein